MAGAAFAAVLTTTRDNRQHSHMALSVTAIPAVNRPGINQEREFS